MKRIITTLFGALILVLGVLSFAPAAHASGGYTDGCWIGTNACMRQNGSATDLWPRDIAGDPNQHYFFQFQGVDATKANCPYAYKINSGVPIYKIYDINGLYVAAGFHSGSIWYVGEQSTNNYATNWALRGNGVWDNCGDNTNDLNNPACLSTTGNYYTQLFTITGSQGCPAWQIIDPK